MRILLDTHALLWALSAPHRLPATLAAAIRDPDNAVYVSAASVWEIALKTELGKLRAAVDEIVTEAKAVGFDELAITHAHAKRVGSLRAHHRDPFARMLVAQALEEGLTIATRDPAFEPYKVATLWDDRAP